MKKIAAVILAVMMFFALCACAKNDENSVITDSSGAEQGSVITGGWSRTGSPVVTDDIKALVDKALDGLDGAEYTPVAYLGSQVVAGTNHAVLCRTAPVVPDAVETWAIIYIYEDLEGNVSLNDVKDFGVPTDIAGEDIDGGWTPAQSPVVTDDVKKAVEKAQEAMTGASFEPVALLSSQIVAGTNYCVLCEETASVPGAEITYAIVRIYADLEGNAEITDIVELPEEEPEQQEDVGMQIANPFVDYASLDEAAQAVGFDLKVPESIEGCGERAVQVMDNSMIQVIYFNGDDRIFIRKQAGSEDISGDYNEYPEQFGVEVGEYVVSMKGENDTANVAVWTNDGYTYAVMSDQALPVSEYVDIISQVK